ncbi:MerR family transcriptional regulator [Salipaludibacillus sp. HK11]|uniref:MerR family transcriptional regulator n=1 Tax=Salipaludibacillus sp. HK11 TaxID=3394320 RepID=UPI0039FCF80B
MKVKEVADLVGISVRTLHHYDEIGLLVPEETTLSGYRMYSKENLERLQQILFFRELGFPLKKIKKILESPTFDRLEALVLQREMLKNKREKLDQMMETIDQTIRYQKGEMTMTNEEKFKGFDFSNNPYEQEARERWGDETVDKYNKKMNQMSSLKQEELQDQCNAIYRKLALIREYSPGSNEAQALIGEWFHLINTFGNYSLDAFKGLGQMYVADQRFTDNIDQYGEGLAVFMSEAMTIYADDQKS